MDNEIDDFKDVVIENIINPELSDYKNRLKLFIKFIFENNDIYPEVYEFIKKVSNNGV